MIQRDGRASIEPGRENLGGVLRTTGANVWEVRSKGKRLEMSCRGGSGVVPTQSVHT